LHLLVPEGSRVFSVSVSISDAPSEEARSGIHRSDLPALSHHLQKYGNPHPKAIYFIRRKLSFRMRIGAIIQARMSSRRLPGKVLRRIGGKPLLQFLLERLEHCSRLDQILVATSVHESDTPIYDFCTDLGIPAYRGSLEDVAERFLDVIDLYPLDAFVRLSADSPLLDQHLVDKCVLFFEKGDYDLVTNVHPRTYPSGESVEVVRSSTFRRAYSSMVSHEDREHVTMYFYRNSHDFSIHNFVSRTYLGDLHLAVDREEDLEVIRGILKKMTRPHWEYSLGELIKMYRGLS